MAEKPTFYTCKERENHVCGFSDCPCLKAPQINLIAFGIALQALGKALMESAISIQSRNSNGLKYRSLSEEMVKGRFMNEILN